MNLGADLYHKLYKSNFYSKPMETQRLFEQAAKEFLEEHKDTQKTDQRS
jgi:hypothetical protein